MKLILFTARLRNCFIPLGLFMLSGCASRSADNSTAPGWKEIAQRVARAVTIGRAFDAGLLASRADNRAGVEHAQRELTRVGDEEFFLLQDKIRPNATESLILLAIQSGALAQFSPNPQMQKRFREREAQNYRAALKSFATIPTTNPERLNALGYFLAERGTTQTDFQTAQRLVQDSLKGWDKAISNTRNERRRAVYEFTRANVRDSLAWAQFRQNQLKLAAQTQEQALREARQSLEFWQKNPGMGAVPTLTPEFPFHLGEIYRAQKRFPQAREQFEAALKLDANFAPARESLRLLPASPNAPDLETSPDTEPAPLPTPDGSLQI